MPGVDDFFPPVQYLPWWGLIGFGMLVLVVAWYVYLFYSTRRRASTVPPVPGISRPAPEAVRAHYLSLIDETTTAHAAGTLPLRDAHHQLSLLLRSYVAEREGVRTLPMTLSDLKETPLTPLTTAVAKLYPGAFSQDYSGTVQQAADEARRVVTTWR